MLNEHLRPVLKTKEQTGLYDNEEFNKKMAAQAAIIESLADHLLEKTGLRFDDDDTISQLIEIGGRVDGNRVYLSGPCLREIIRADAPGSFTMLAGDPALDKIIGKGHPPVLAPVYGAPDVLLKNGRRTGGSRSLYQEMVAMADEGQAIGNTGHMLCVMHDVPEQERPVEMAHAHLKGSQKSFMGSVASPAAVMDVINLTRSTWNRKKPDKASCQLLHLINATPPLVYQSNPLKCLRAVSCAGEGVIVASFMMLGATAPVTVTGALAQGYAECLAGLALTQIWRPGTPVVMALYGMQFSMRTMKPWFGDPMSQLIQLYSTALARHLGVPSRGDGFVTSSYLDDAQSGYESARAMAIALQAGSDFILHSAGWLDSGRCVSMSKFEREAAAALVNPGSMPGFTLFKA